MDSIKEIEMHKVLVDESQPFGVVKNERTGMGSPCDYGGRNAMGALTERPNHGFDHGPSLMNQAPGAGAKAAAHNSDPFYWTGRAR